MTLAELVTKARQAGSQMTTWQIPVMKDGLHVNFDLEIDGNMDEGYHVEITNYREG